LSAKAEPKRESSNTMYAICSILARTEYTLEDAHKVARHAPGVLRQGHE
jgi:hypothetical protein